MSATQAQIPRPGQGAPAEDAPLPPEAQQLPNPHDPFPKFKYTGDLRAVYPLTPKSKIPPSILKPNYSREYIRENTPTRSIKINSEETIAGMRKACALAREVLDLVAAHVRPGVTTDYLDQICVAEAVKRDCYPSPLGYHGYPKSVCTSVNEVICHGIPDQYVLQDGDIINLDVTLFHKGYHGDLNMTYPVGPKARANDEAMKLIKTARQCLDIAIALCGPGIPYGALGHVIEPVAQARGCSVVKNYTGHGIGRDMFHGPPTVFHHRTRKAYGVMAPGHIFTIEPMLNLGDDWRDVSWPDDWTVASASGKWSAASEETLLITETGVEVLTAQGGAKSYDTTSRRQAWARAEHDKAQSNKK